jgi:hypothetical protein
MLNRSTLLPNMRVQGARKGRVPLTRVVSSLEIRTMSKFLLAILVLSLTGIAHAETLKYEAATVRLVGKLMSGKGMTPDEKEVSFPAIKLNVPVRVEADAKDELNETEENVTLVQLILNHKQMEQYESQKGQLVAITGKLSHAITGHHFTKVLIEVEKIERQ